ncbi:MAG TPA: SPOR domain-containing protein [Lentibacillus sp.]|uniref:SPOR domain-containing protein n=1 Tax=Lentibacillus sp. TaxID=1925746 RepID=UPI002B4AB975|nr:SPOR domain-containing protein [Lentibacillus sp.]HLR62608.1 SPOR domain-containing protein [Lentibacillus sp.]
MGQNKKVDVWMNGKKTKLKKKAGNTNKQHSIKESNDEHAASLENSNIPEYVRQENEDGKKDRNKKINYKRKSKLKRAKPFLIASISAVIIGAFLGFFMLNMFVDINRNITQQDSSSSSAAADKENSMANAESADATAIDALSAYVVQAGKFSEQANAEEMAATVQDAGFSAMVWENGAFYFVLSGISTSEQQAEQTATGLADNGIEVYVKEWQTETNEITLPDNEKEWLQMYEQQWKEAVDSVSSGNHLSKDAWAEVIDAVPENTESISGIAKALNEQHQAMGQTDKWQEQVILLKLWEQFSQLISQ